IGGRSPGARQMISPHRTLLKLIRRRRLHSDLEAELAYHREHAREHGNAVDLGNATAVKESALDLWRFTFLKNVWRDLLFAARGLRRNSAFPITAVLSLAGHRRQRRHVRGFERCGNSAPPLLEC